MILKLCICFYYIYIDISNYVNPMEKVMSVLERVQNFYKRCLGHEFTVDNIDMALRLLSHNYLRAEEFTDEQEKSVVSDMAVLFIMDRLGITEEDAVLIREKVSIIEKQIIELLDLEFDNERTIYMNFWEYFVKYHNRYVENDYMSFDAYVYQRTKNEIHKNWNDVLVELVIQYKQEKIKFIQNKGMLKTLIEQYACYFYMIMYNVDIEMAKFLVENVHLYNRNDGFLEIDEQVGKFFKFNKL